MFFFDIKDIYHRCKVDLRRRLIKFHYFVTSIHFCQVNIKRNKRGVSGLKGNLTLRLAMVGQLIFGGVDGLVTFPCVSNFRGCSLFQDANFRELRVGHGEE